MCEGFKPTKAEFRKMIVICYKIQKMSKTINLDKLIFALGLMFEKEKEIISEMLNADNVESITHWQYLMDRVNAVICTDDFDEYFKKACQIILQGQEDIAITGIKANKDFEEALLDLSVYIPVKVLYRYIVILSGLLETRYNLIKEFKSIFEHYEAIAEFDKTLTMLKDVLVYDKQASDIQIIDTIGLILECARRKYNKISTQLEHVRRKHAKIIPESYEQKITEHYE